jgi:hypothetical protein
MALDHYDIDYCFAWMVLNQHDKKEIENSCTYNSDVKQQDHNNEII